MREDWITCQLGNLLEIQRGGSPRPIKEFITNRDNGINWVKIGDTTESGKFISSTEQKIKPEGLHKTRLVYPGDFILSNSMSFGRPYIMSIKGAIHDGWLLLRDTSDILNKSFLFHILGSPFVYNQFSKLAKGSTVKNLNISLVSQVKINLVSKSEQRAIVAKIEELFSELDKGEEDLKRAQEQLKIYRQAVLKKAFEGELTNTRLNRLAITELGTILTGSTPTKKDPSNYDSADYNFYKPIDLDAGNNVISSNDFLSKKGYENSRQVPALSILVTCIGATIGKTGLIKREGGFNQQINAIVPFKNYIPEFIFYQATSIDFQTQIKTNASSTTLPILNKGKFSKLRMNVCSPKEQHQIVKEIESRLSVCESIEASIRESLDKSKSLRQSILKKAFEGTLLSEEEIAACKAAPDYEPASVLLERIKAEKKKK